MRPLVRFTEFVNEEFDGLDDFEDLEDFRHYRGSVEQFKKYMDKKAGQEINPYKGMDYKYPRPHKMED